VTFMPSVWWDDDASLLAELDEAWYSAQQVPAEFIEAGKAVWVPPDLDAELAQLIYDSQREPAGVRTDTAELRALTFASATQTIELEVAENGLLGQLVPPCRSHIEVQLRDGGTTSASADELGFFTIPTVPGSAFRLRYRTAGGVEVITSWITI
jgi:hypothetical protein